MSDFDKIFRDKLNEEETFPRMDRNWQRVFSRLPAEPVAPKISWWQWAVAASVAGLVASSAWLWYDLNRTKQALKTIIAQQASAPNAPSIVYQRDTVFVDKNSVPSMANSPNSQVGKGENTSILNKKGDLSAQTQNEDKSIPNLSKNNIVSSNTNKASTPSVFSPNFEKNKPTTQGKNEVVAPVSQMDVTKDKTIVQKETIKNEFDNSANNTTNIAKNNEPKPVDIPTENPQNQATKNAAVAENTPQKDVINDTITDNKKEKIATAPVVSEAKLDNNSDKKSIDNQQDTASSLAHLDVPKQEERTTDLQPTPNTIAEKSTLPTDIKQEDMATKPIIQPIKWRPTFALGLNGLAYLPKNIHEIPLSKGFGASFRLGISNRLKFDMAYEHTRAEYRFMGPKPRFHHPKDRNRPPSLDIELRGIEGSQKRTQLTLNALYFLTHDKWINPYISIGYASQRVASQKAKFEYFDKRLNNKITVFENAAPQSFSKLLNLGFGVDKPIYKQWSLAASAYYQKDLSNEIDDSWLLRGGIRYTF